MPHMTTDDRMIAKSCRLFGRDQASEQFPCATSSNPSLPTRRSIRPIGAPKHAHAAATFLCGRRCRRGRRPGSKSPSTAVRSARRHAIPSPFPIGALAQAAAAEWDAQGEFIEPARMPLTRLANTIIDGVAAAPDAVAAEVEKYLGTDLLVLPRRGPGSPGGAPEAALGPRARMGADWHSARASSPAPA